MKQKRAQVGMTVQNLITLAVGLLFLAGVIVGVAAFKGSQYSAGCANTTFIKNSSKANCYWQAKDPGNKTGTYFATPNAAYNLTQSVESMSNSLSNQLSTVGIMLGVGLIIAAVAVLGVGLMRQI